MRATDNTTSGSSIVASVLKVRLRVHQNNSTRLSVISHIWIFFKGYLTLRKMKDLKIVKKSFHYTFVINCQSLFGVWELYYIVFLDFC